MHLNFLAYRTLRVPAPQLPEPEGEMSGHDVKIHIGPNAALRIAVQTANAQRSRPMEYIQCTDQGW
jgi:hypothetical protein